MGLELYDLLMEVEKKFDIKISDTDAQSLVTVGDLYEFITANVATSSEKIDSLVSFAMAELTAGLETCGIAKKIEPAAKLKDIIP